MPDIFSKFTHTVKTHSLIDSGDRILLSLSAGKDSMAMLDLMMRYRQIINFDIAIFHLNHMMRGQDAFLDEDFVCEKARSLKIIAYIRQYDFNSQTPQGISFEEHARNVRYSMLSEIASLENFNKIATAHNKSDNAETLLMRIFLGTGIYGLKGIEYTSGNIIRPMLDLMPEEIYSYLRENSIAWREDLSNKDCTYSRNYIRNKIMPLVTERFADAISNIIKISAHAKENEQLLDLLYKKSFPDTVFMENNSLYILTDTFKNDSALIKYKLGREIYRRYGFKFKQSIFDEILKRYNLPKTNILLYQNNDFIIRKSLYKEKKCIVIENNSQLENFHKWEYDISLFNNGNIFITEIKRYFYFEKTDFNDFIQNKGRKDLIFMALPDSEKSITLRNRRDGDRILLESGTKKIKDLMIEKKLDIKIKERIPLIIVGREIAAYIPSAITEVENRVSCNFWVKSDSDLIYKFYFKD
ncbi:MAG TPA: tRNA lysidine(34) synthetase TilS [Spirochaetota bacterium]|nr:tRNA lysidine(34) synthetase TilS [Spirochaetota bacterium]